MKKVSRAAVLACLLIFPALRGSTEMLGPIHREDILKQNPDWEAVVAAYNPQPDCVERLRSINYEVKIDVYLGTWCSDSKAHVSEFFKVLDLADNPLIQARYVGIPRDKAQRAPYCQSQAIERLPTFVVFIGGREKGRIVEAPKVSVERDILEILAKN